MVTTSESVRVLRKKSVERVGCHVYLSANQLNLTSGNWTKVNLNTREYDLGGNFDIVNYKFTAPVTGLYAFHAKIDFESVVANKTYAVGIYINNVLTFHKYSQNGAATDEIDSFISGESYLNAGDYIELYALSLAGVDTVDISGGNYHTILGVRLITKEGTRQ